MAYPYTSYQNPWQQGYYPMYQQPQYQQPVQQTMQQTQQTYSPVINQNGIIWISGESEAAMYPIAPNNAVALWEKSGKTIYLKQADATGKPSMKVYDLVERAETPADGVSETDGKLPAYATKEELKAVVDAVKSFGVAITSAQSDIDALKGDMYGIAGKKKSARKTQEVAEDDE